MLVIKLHHLIFFKELHFFQGDDIYTQVLLNIESLQLKIYFTIPGAYTILRNMYIIEENADFLVEFRFFNFAMQF